MHTKKRLLFSVIGAVILGTLMYLGFSLFSSSETILDVPAPTLQTEAIAFEYADEWVPELPVRLVIPTLGIDATVQYVGLDASGSGEMGVPSNFEDVGWYQDGVRPGMRGSAVMAGHYNGKGVPEAVFYELHTLDIGDEIVIMSAERVEDIFFVVKIETYDYDESAEEIFISTDGKKRLNLITCGGQWLSEERRFDKRTVVFAELLTDVE